ncbi:MAG: choice-of-anchor D domain-containing protein [bacterium]|nr:choice-of-anchor D domain-containing protein [bacterium]
MQLLKTLKVVVVVAVFSLLMPAVFVAQTLTMFEMDSTAFPQMSAKFYAFDADGRQLQRSVGELTLKENGTVRTISKVTCPPASNPRPVSLVLTMDVSGSMAEGDGSTTNIDIARAGARKAINKMPLAVSECAITAFDDKNYFLQDFTSNRSLLLAAVNALTPGGGTDYDKGLLNPPAGALQVSKDGRFRKVVVFLTDGMPIRQEDGLAIITEAQKQACIVYVVTLGIACPASLKSVTSITGGKWFENITTVAEAEAVYMQILGEIQSGPPCTISWQSVNCPEEERLVEFSDASSTDSTSYAVSSARTAKLLYAPYEVFFRPNLGSPPFDTVITVTAQNSAVTVTDITSSNPAYTISPRTFSLAAGQKVSLTVTYVPPDSGYTFTEFTFISNLCTEHYYASGGYPGKPPTIQTLKLLTPNGGELLVGGSHALVTWTGIPATENCKLEYSLDRGNTWVVITSAASGLSYDWLIPNEGSIRCLVRISRVPRGTSTGAGALFSLKGGRGKWSADGLRVASVSGSSIVVSNPYTGQIVHTIVTNSSLLSHLDWNSDGIHVAVCGLPDHASIWNTRTGELLNLVQHDRPVYRVRWSNDGTRLATVSLDGAGRIYTSDGVLQHSLRSHRQATYDVTWNPQGNRVVTVSMDASGIVWNANTGVFLSPFLAEHSASVKVVAWSPDGKLIATGSDDGTVVIWDAETRALLHTLNPNGAVSAVRFSPDSKRLLTGSYKTASTWIASTGTEEFVMTGHTNYVSGVCWSEDGQKIGTAGGVSFVWDANTGTQLQQFGSATAGATDIEFSPDGQLLSTSTGSYTAIWSMVVEAPLLVDTSDATFSIVRPSPRVFDIDMKSVLVNTVKDSVITGFVMNAGQVPFTVDSVKIEGTSASMFSVVSGAGPYVINGSSNHALELRFAPLSPGARTASLTVHTSAGSFTVSLKGVGIQPVLEIVGQDVDFGKVAVGSSKTLTQVATIKNTGTAPIAITGVRIGGPNTTDFTATITGQPFTLEVGGIVKLTDMQFNARADGRTSSRLLFDYNGVGSPATIAMHGEGVADGPQENAKVELLVSSAVAQRGQLVTIIIVLLTDSNLVNSGATSFTGKFRFEDSLLLPQSPTPAGIVVGRERIIDFSFPVVPDVDRVLTTLHFRATVATDTVTVLSLENVEAVGGTVNITTHTGLYTLLPGDTVPPDTVPQEFGRVLLAVGSDTGKTGDIVSIPITLISDSNLIDTRATSFTGRLRYNATMLRPLSPLVPGPFTGIDAVVDVSMPAIPNANGVLTTLQFRIALGNDSVCVLALENMQAVGGNVAFMTEDGLFTLDEICREGGARLLNPNGLIDLTSVSPNPILNGFTDVTIELSETGHTTLSLSDLQGRAVKTFLDGNLGIGRRTYALDVSALAAGAYLLCLRTPTEVVTIRLEVAP